MTPQEQTGREAFWSYLDVAFFASFMFLSFVMSILLAGLLHRQGPVIRLLLPQLLLYVFVVGSLYAIFHLRYSEPFWRTLGVRYPDKRAWGFAFLGPVLAIALGLLGPLLRAREIQLPFDDFLRTPLTMTALGVLVVLLGPFCEELVFRGFLMPLFVRSLTAVPGILLAALMFGCMHGPEYRWSWQYILLVSLAGVAFGYARQRGRSTTAAFLMHATFNLTQFAALVFHPHTRW